MFKWSVEEQALSNEGALVVGNERIFDCERKVSRKDKIAFVDSMQDGKCSYILDLIAQFESDAPKLTKDKNGHINTNALKAWVKRNDTKYSRPLIDAEFNYGKYRLLGTARHIQYNYKGQYDYYDDLVDELFHRQLKVCLEEEKRYFREHDEYEILKQKFRDRHYETTFGVPIWDCSDGSLMIADETGKHKRNLTIDELKDLLSKYEQLDALVAKLTAETDIKY